MKKLIIGMVLIVSIALAKYNLSLPDNNFWEVSFVQIINLIIAIGVSYYLVQKANSTNRQKDKISVLVEKIQLILANSNLWLFSTREEKKKALILQRSLANKVVILKNIKVIKEEDYKVNVKQLEDKISEIRDCYSLMLAEHSGDVHIEKMLNCIALADDKCDIIQTLLF